MATKNDILKIKDGTISSDLERTLFQITQISIQGLFNKLNYDACKYI